jgi:hypothetical protein
MIGEFLISLFGGAAFIGSAVKQVNRKHISNVRQIVYRDCYNELIEKWEDIALEKQLRVDVVTPSKFEEFWERIEQYKEDGGDMVYLFPDLWRFVGTKRLPVFDIKKKNKHLTRYFDDYGTNLQHNRSVTVRLLMQTYNKMALVDIEYSAKVLAAKRMGEEPSPVILSCCSEHENLDHRLEFLLGY